LIRPAFVLNGFIVSIYGKYDLVQIQCTWIARDLSLTESHVYPKEKTHSHALAKSACLCLTTMDVATFVWLVSFVYPRPITTLMADSMDLHLTSYCTEPAGLRLCYSVCDVRMPGPNAGSTSGRC